MRWILTLAVLWTAVPAGGSWADEPAAPADETSRLSGEAFVTAFNAGDAKAAAALWTADGEYVDQLGQATRGREAIEKAYAALFATHPGIKIALNVTSSRRLTADTAMESGTAVVKFADRAEVSASGYITVLVRQEGKWFSASVRDLPLPPPSADSHRKDLDWLVGTWTAQGENRTVEVRCQWIAGKRFLQRTYTARDKEQELSSGMQIIGVDPVSGQVVSWSFDSQGGHGTGQWTPRDRGWRIQSAGILPDGARSASVEFLLRVDDTTLSWQSVQRVMRDQRLPDTAEILLKRVSQTAENH